MGNDKCTKMQFLAMLVIMSTAFLIAQWVTLDIAFAENEEVVINSEAYVESKDNGDGTCTITKFRFKADTSPTRIMIPKFLSKEGQSLKITKIGAQAFAGCGLESIKFAGDSEITHIGKEAFTNNSISSLKLPDELVEIGDYAFASTSGIGKLDLGNCSKLIKIGNRAFYNAGITEVDLPDSLLSIGSWGFATNSIRKTIKIPKNVLTIGAGAFTGRKVDIDCSLHQPGSITGAPWAAGVISIENSRVIWNNRDYQIDFGVSDSRIPFYFDKINGNIYGLKDDLTAQTSNYLFFNKETGELTIPGKINDVPVKGFTEFALANTGVDTAAGIKKVTMDANCNISSLSSSLCRGLAWLKEFVLNDKVTNVKDLCFHKAGIVEIDLKNVETISDNAFYSTVLKKVKIGSSIKSIGKIAFPDLDNLKRIEVDKPKDGITGAPWGATYTTVYWKDGKVTEPVPLLTSNDGKWRFDPVSGTLHKYLLYEEGGILDVPSKVVCGTDTYDIKTLGFSRYNLLGNPQNPGHFSKVVIPNGIEEICYAFNGINVDSVDMSNAKTLKKITSYAFYSSNLTNIVIPDSVEELGVMAFANNDFSGQMELSKNIKDIDNNTFEGCHGITSFKIDQFSKQESTGDYPYASDSVINKKPYGAPNVLNSIFFADQSRPAVSHSIEPQASDNKIRIWYEVGTNITDDVGKDITPKDNMPSVKITNRPESDGTQNKLKGHMDISSHDSGVQSGNGTYTVTMKCGYSGSSSSDYTMDYPVKINQFYTIEYDANPPISSLSGAVPRDNGAYVEGYGIKVANGNSLSVPGFRFIGWAETPDGDMEYEADNTLTMPGHNVTLYAKWEEVPTEVTLDANGGSFENGKETISVSGRFNQLLTQTKGYEVPTRDKDTFLGWAKSRYADSPDVTKVPDSSATYYAVWGSGSVTLTFDANGGTIDGSGSCSLFGYPGTEVDFPDVARKGYEHVGWALDKEGVRPVTDVTMPNRDMTYYATWKPLLNTVTFPDGEGGRSNTEDIKVKSGAAVGVRPEAAAEAGYEFTGQWLCSEGGIFTADEVADYIITGKNEIVSFTPLFLQKGFAMIVYDFNGGVFEDAGLKMFRGHAGSDFEGLLPEPEKKGFSFEWDRERPSRFPGEGECIIVKARWSPSANRVEFKAGAGGNTSTEPKTVLSGTAVGVIPVATASEGFIFTGLWECSEGGFFSPEQVKNYIITGDNETVTFTAAFQAKTKSLVKFVVTEGGTLLTEPEKTVDGGHMIGIAPEIRVDGGYTFDGMWKCSEGGTFTKDEIRKYRVSGENEEITFTAMTTKNPMCRVRFSAGEAGAVTPSYVDVIRGQKVGVEPKAPDNNAYIFVDSWKCSEGGTYTAKEIADYVPMNSDEITFTVGFSKKEDKGDQKPGDVPKHDPDDDTSSPWAGEPESKVDKRITSSRSEELPGATFGVLQLKGTSKSKNMVTLTWKKLPKVKKYVVYGSNCGVKNRYKKFKTLKKNSNKLNVKKIKGKKVKKGTYYKFVVVAYDKNGKTIAVSKTVHVTTAGGKKGNDKAIKLKKPTKSKMTLKVKKTHKIKAKEVMSKKKTSRHRKIAYESTNRKVAKVVKGKIVAVGKGKAVIYVYAQNGVFKKIKLTVK